MLCQSRRYWVDHPDYTWHRVRVTKLPSRSFLQPPSASSLFNPMFSSGPCPQIPTSPRSSFNVRDQVSHPQETTGKIIVLYILNFIVLHSSKEDKMFYTNGSKHYPNSVLSVCLCIPPINFCMTEPALIRLGTYIMAPEHIPTAYFINPSQQSVCLHVYPPIVVRRWLHKKNCSNEYTCNNRRIVAHVVLYWFMSYQGK
jgi:hypothetical protein